MFITGIKWLIMKVILWIQNDIKINFSIVNTQWGRETVHFYSMYDKNNIFVNVIAFYTKITMFDSV